MLNFVTNEEEDDKDMEKNKLWFFASMTCFSGYTSEKGQQRLW